MSERVKDFNYARLAALVEATGLSRRVLARRIGVNASTLQMWVSGFRKPELYNMNLLASYFDVPLNYFNVSGAEEINTIEEVLNTHRHEYAKLIEEANDPEIAVNERAKKLRDALKILHKITAIEKRRDTLSHQEPQLSRILKKITVVNYDGLSEWVPDKDDATLAYFVDMDMYHLPSGTTVFAKWDDNLNALTSGSLVVAEVNSEVGLYYCITKDGRIALTPATGKKDVHYYVGTHARVLASAVYIRTRPPILQDDDTLMDAIETARRSGIHENMILAAIRFVTNLALGENRHIIGTQDTANSGNDVQ